MKKMLCLILSVVIALGALSVLAFAADAPEVSLKVDKQTVRKGDTVIATVNVSKDSRICAAMINFLYDTDCFNLVSAEVNGSLGMGFINESAGNGKVRYVVANESVITAETTLFTVKLKVKAPNGKLSLDIEEIGVDNNGVAENVTAKVKAKSTLEAVLTCRHDFKETIIKPATCVKDGEKVQECKICGLKNESTPIKAKGHTLNTVTVEPTCDKAGKKYDECTVCGWKSAETVLKAKGHDIKIINVEPTCEKDGEIYSECTVCGWKSESVVLKAGHKAGNWEVVKEATETETGTKVKKCTVCGAVVEEAEIPVKEPDAIKGDVNGDGELTAVDARMILRHVARVETLTLSQMANADISGDLKITAVDARRILRIVAGLE